MPESKRKHTATNVKGLAEELDEMKIDLKNIHKELEGNVTISLLAKIVLASFGMLLGLWSLVWFALKVYIKNEILQLKIEQELRYFQSSEIKRS